ncbi:MAG: hypothetical protein PWQ55_2318 [Chloroflexota bacterium]|nr:hypothetical protein [Chloroflexota bacterium]
MNISVFGGSKTPPDSPDYQQALALGRGLAEAGHTVLTGGYRGTMEAVSRGAAEGGGRTVGVTCSEIESWRAVQPNPWLSDKVQCATLDERLQYLVRECELAIALPGGIGTLTELSLTWNLMVIDAIPHKPILLVASGWEQTLKTFYSALDDYIPAQDRQFLVFCPDAAAALDEVAKYRPANAQD